MSAPTLKVTEEKPDPNQVSVCTLLAVKDVVS